MLLHYRGQDTSGRNFMVEEGKNEGLMIVSCTLFENPNKAEHVLS